MSDADKPFGPDVEITFPQGASGVAIWAKVSATDMSGVTIRNIKKGDIIRVEAIAGFCSFSDKSFVEKLKSVADIVGGILTSGLPLPSKLNAKEVGDALKKAASPLKSYSGSKGKVRTGYGKVKGKDRFSTKEGGIIVCMPSAHGPIYSAKDTHLRENAKKYGRLPKYVPSSIQNWCFFPCRKEGGLMEKTALKDGPAYILVFDKQYSDNAGAYEVKLTVTRPGRRAADMRKKLASLFGGAGL